MKLFRRSVAHIPEPDSGDDQDWMISFSTLDDRDVELLLSGELAAVSADLAPVAALFDELRTTVDAEPVPEMSPELQQMLLAGPNVIRMDLRQAASRSLVRAASAAAVAVIALVGVGASQNRLPVAMQDVVSSTAAMVGVDVPSADERADKGPGTNNGGANNDGTNPNGTTNNGGANNDGTNPDPGSGTDRAPGTNNGGANNDGTNPDGTTNNGGANNDGTNPVPSVPDPAANPGDGSGAEAGSDAGADAPGTDAIPEDLPDDAPDDPLAEGGSRSARAAAD